MKFIITNQNKDVAQNARQAIVDWYNEGKDFTVAIDKRVNKRSNPQNRYLWGVVYKIIADELGYAIDDIHELMATKFIPDREIEIFGKTKIVPKSTAKLSTEEFNSYIEQIRAFVAQYGIIIQDPE